MDISTVGKKLNNFLFLKTEIKMKKKCDFCSKKVGFLGFECKCKNVYCPLHRLPENHQCSFNHRFFEKTLLDKKINIKCHFQKVEKI